MTANSGFVSASFHLGPKGRAVIPVALRRAARVAEDDTLLAHVNELGQIVIESEATLKQRLWAAAGAPAPGADPVAEIRTMRREDVEISDRNQARRSTARGGRSDERSQALLAHLGL